MILQRGRCVRNKLALNLIGIQLRLIQSGQFLNDHEIEQLLVRELKKPAGTSIYPEWDLSRG